MVRNSLIITQIIFTIGAVASVFLLSDTSEVVFILLSMELKGLLLSFVFFSISIALNSFRYFLLNTYFYSNFDLKQAFSINIKSLAYSQLLFPIIAQALGRVLHTKKFVNRPEFQIFITVFEKVIAAAMLLLLVFLLMFFYFEIKILKSDMLSYFFVLFLGVLFVFFTNALIIFKKSNWSDFKTVISVFTNAKIYYLLPISAFAHLNTLMAMHFLGSTFFPELKITTILSVSALLMLVTAIPISFSSWGIRELSAIAILGKHGIDAETSVAFGIIIGLAYFFTVCFWFVLVTVFPFKNEAKKSNSKQKLIDFENYKQPLLGLLVCLLGVVFPVQIRVPVDGGLLTLNLADPVAFLAGLSFLISWIIHYRHLPLWMVSSFKYGLILLPIIFVVSYGIGFHSFGSNNWALINRLVGLFIPFSFLFTGAILGMFLERTQVRQLFFSLSISLLGYAVFQICFQFYVDENIKELFGWSNLSGFYQDRNAYSLFLLLALAGLLPLINDTKNVFSAEKLLIALIVLALFVAGSRTAFVALLIVFARLIHTNHRLVFRLVPVLLFLFGSYGALIYVVDFFSGINSANEVIFSRFIKSDITSISDIRLLSWSPAWNIWLENPLFGSGLGYYYEHYRVVVHNLPLWLLSETGLFGFLLFSIIPISIFQACFPVGQKDLSARRTSLLYGTIIIVIFSLSQDIIFQRSIWFFIGFFMVCRPIIIKKT